MNLSACACRLLSLMWLLLFNSALCSPSIPSADFSNATPGLLFSSNSCFLLTPTRPQVFYWPLFKTNNVCCLQHRCELPQMLKLQINVTGNIIVAGLLLKMIYNIVFLCCLSLSWSWYFAVTLHSFKTSMATYEQMLFKVFNQSETIQ